MIEQIKGWPLLRLGFVLIVLLASVWLGLRDGVHSYQGAESALQRVAALLQIGYGALALVALPAVLSRSSWLRPVIWLWGAALVGTAFLAPVAWGGAAWASGIAAALVTALVAGLVIWLSCLHISPAIR